MKADVQMTVARGEVPLVEASAFSTTAFALVS